MTDGDVDPRLVKIALAETEGFEFERFAQELFSALVGVEFVPMGGIHDDGADGAQESLYSDDRGQFWQFSVRADVKQKVRHTIRRLRESDLNPSVVWYCTSQLVEHQAVLQDELQKEFGVVVQFRDRLYIENQINQSPQTRTAFHRHLAHRVDYLKAVGSARSLPPSSSVHVKSPDVFVFLQQEVDRRSGDATLVDAVCDSLILWALEGTDPAAGRFMSESQIRLAILEAIPSVEALLAGRISRCLERLSTKRDGTRLVNWHAEQAGYCLPYETRARLVDESVEDEALRTAVEEHLTSRIVAHLADGGSFDDASIGATAVLRVIHEAFAERGLAFANWAHDDGADVDQEHYQSLGERLSGVIAGLPLSPERREALFQAAKHALGGAFYSSTADERLYFGKLSRTYVLLFSLQQEPRVLKYFQEMAGSFRLFVGADQIIRALSERYLPEADQMTRTMLRIAQAAGTKLLLTETVANEVAAHLKASDLEHTNFVLPIEEAGRVDADFATQVPKILVRAYLYAKLAGGPRAPGSWEDFLGQFCDVRALRRGDGLASVVGYVRSQFGMGYVSEAELRAQVEPEELKRLTDSLVESKPMRLLAEHDALLVLTVYSDRRRHHEHPGNSPFGFNTWWLTDEVKVIRHTVPLVKANAGARYMMRPDFLLNFLALAPSVAAVRSTFQEVFPTLLGIRLSKRMSEAAFHGVLQPLREWSSWEPGRRNAAVEDLANRLKGDMAKVYTTQLRTAPNE